MPDWETFRANAAHNGFVPITLDPGKFAKAWEWKAPSIPDTSFVYVGMLVTGGDSVYSLVTREAANGLADSYVALAGSHGRASLGGARLARHGFRSWRQQSSLQRRTAICWCRRCR